MQHAKLSPSSASRWLTCTASVEACEGYEKKGNSDAAWGTTTHALGELLLKDLAVPEVGEILEGLPVTKDMIECASEYTDYCKSFIKEDSVVIIEGQFDLSFIAENTFGTSDFTCLTGTHLDVIDLKTGHNIVRADNNPQLQLYGLGAVYELEDLGYEIETITLHIMQSRANHIDTIDMTYAELKEFEEFAKEQATKIRTGNTTFNPEVKACKWCPHNTNCEALRNFTEEIIKGDFDDLSEVDVGETDTTHIQKVLDNADLIRNFITACEAKALELMQDGVEIAGYKLVESKTNRKWADEAEVEAYLKKKRIKADVMYQKKLISMTAILKLRPDDKVLQGMLIKPEGKPTIAPLSDKRPALNAVVDCFDNLDEEF